jgi:SpoU rRNA methylase family enzyme
MPYDKIENICVVFIEKQNFLAIVEMELEFDVVVFGVSKLGSIARVVF